MSVRVLQALLYETADRVSGTHNHLVRGQHELEEAIERLATVLDGSSDTDMVDALATLRQIDEQIQQLSGQAGQIRERVKGYRGRI